MAMDGIIAAKGRFFARLARTAEDLAAAQRLRHEVFMDEGSASPAPDGHDRDSFDENCDHLLVWRCRDGKYSEDRAPDDKDLAGTCRLIGPSAEGRPPRYYSSSEYDLLPLLERKRDLKFLELGRSCVRVDLRAEPVAELLWQGIWNYVRRHCFDVMIGCASFAGTDPETHADSLTYLAHQAQAPEDWRVSALPDRYVEMRRKPMSVIDGRAALRALPPLIKGYVKLGCHVGEGAVIDYAFNTTDVLILLPVAVINPRYFAHFGNPGVAPLN
jgi:L-ornithine Nalpha-acyltransferase